MARFCPKCGKRIDSGVFCDNCKSDSIDYKLPVIRMCCTCQRLFTHGSWKRTNDPETLIKKEIKSKIKQDDIKVNLLGELTDLKPGLTQNFVAEVDHRGVIHEIPFNVEVTYCSACSKKGTQYFEGILQIRNLTDERRPIVNFQINKDDDHDNVVNKIVEFPNGLDLYMTKKKFIPKLAQKIIQQLGGLTTSNVKLFSHNHQTGKDIYRLNVLLELPEFEKEDVFFYNKKYIVINNLSKFISARNLLTNKTVLFRYNEYKELKQKDSTLVTKLEKHKTKVIRTRPHIEVLHPETYQPLRIINSVEVSNDEEVEIILTDKGAILI